MKRIFAFALFAAITAAIGCVVEFPEECDSFTPCENPDFICEFPYLEEDYGYCVAPGGGNGGCTPCDGGSYCFEGTERCNGFPAGR